MTTTTDAIARMVGKELDRLSGTLNTDGTVQQITITVKMKQQWPFRILTTINHCVDKNDQ